MNKRQGQLIVALDVATLKEATKLVDTLGVAVDIYKVGSQLFTACGADIIPFLLKKDKKIFLDLKFHDIPNTVALSIQAAIGLSGEKHSGIYMLTVHTSGGKEMLEAAVKAGKEKAAQLKIKKPFIIGVTVLTSEESGKNITDVVLERTQLAKSCGLDGVVASSQETARIREKFGKEFIVVTPGIRPLGATQEDQKRVATPFDAIVDGSDYLVVGRPIVKAKQPLKACREILKEIKEAAEKT